jgi:putative tricarboxylic transport membrane protein
LASVAAVLAIVGGASAQSFPSKTVEFVAHSGPGGGPDVFARAVTEIITRQKLLSQPVIVANRAGGAGTVALNYVKNKRGDPHVVLTIATGTVLTAASRADLDLGLNNYTPLALFAVDPQTIAVKADSKYQTFKDLVEAARREPSALIAGIGGPEGNSRRLLYRIERETGAKFKFVVFKGGTDAVLAVLGGHVTFAPENIPEMLPHVQAGTMRVLAVAGDRRNPALPQTPTLAELGHPISVGTGRGFAMPAGVPREAAAAMETALKRVHESAAWKDYAAKQMLEDSYLGGAEFAQYLARLREEWHGFMAYMGHAEKQ